MTAAVVLSASSLVTGPDSTHPNLVLIATGPVSPHMISPVVSCQ